MSLAARKHAQYLMMSDRLKRLAGEEFERHQHPAIILDRASGPGVRVWGWWTVAGDLPCVLWAGDLGWSATAVGPDTFDSEGYERAFWSHRIKLLDLALANALGPARTLEDLELQVASDTSYGLDLTWTGVKGALLWGILQLRAARAQRRQIVRGGAAVRPMITPEFCGVTDDDLVQHGLAPTLAKARWRPRPVDLGASQSAVRATSAASAGSPTTRDKQPSDRS